MIFNCELQAVQVAARKKPWIFIFPLINWSYGMDDIFCREMVGARNSCLAGGTSADFTTFIYKPRAGSSVDCTIYTTAAQERRVGCIDNGVKFEGGNIPSHNFYAVKNLLFHDTIPYQVPI